MHAHNSTMSPRTFLLMSLGIFSCSSAVGALYAARKEVHKVQSVDRVSAVGIAVRAFSLGTILCVGTFVGGVCG
jgi:hypothetical protein